MLAALVAWMGVNGGGVLGWDCQEVVVCDWRKLSTHKACACS
jgi:hypothetical protein